MAKIKAVRYGSGTIQKQIDAVKESIRTAAKQDIIALALNIHGRLVDNPPGGTPVDTGWASNNWWLSVGSPARENTGLPGKDGSLEGRDTKAQQSAADVFSWDFSKGSIYISNNVPYINRLNNGWSKQAPAGFVDQAVQIEVTRFTHSTNYRAIDRDN